MTAITAPAGHAPLPVLSVRRDWQELLAGGVSGPLGHALCLHLPTRRWFGGKGEGPGALVDATPVRVGLRGGALYVVLVTVDSPGGGRATYQLALTAVHGASAARLLRDDRGSVLAVVEGDRHHGATLLCDATVVPAACARLLRAVACGRSLPGTGVRIRGRSTLSMRRDAAAGALPGLVPGARDQSNTSLRFGKRCVMKLYRRVEPGPNPDEEVARFLAERTGFRHVPAWLGSLTWHRGGVTSTLATVTAWVESRGDAWNLTLGHVRAYLARCHDHAVALSNLAPPDHPTRLLADRPPSGLVQDLLGEYGDWARLLGERTAHLHRALASCPEDPAFAPESLTPAHSLHTVASIRRQASAVFHLLRQRLADLPAPVLQDAREVLHLEARVESVLEAATHTGHGHAFVTRHHGDLHLGQVLWTGEDFVVLDFEGEPARPVAERRRKALPLRDVAGMVRSFHYAARAVALEDGVGGEQLAWLEHWFEAAAGLYLRAYLSATQGEPWAPHPGAGKAWLEALVLEKACYELAYELGNRPDWVGIPLHGVLRALRS